MSHFKVLYRQFLFRLMDVEFLAASARGDASELLGQFAAILILVSLVLSYAALIFGGGPKPQEIVWLAERLLIEVTMLVVGIFAILSWDSTFPDRRDVQILAPMPVRGRAIFRAKVAASASALGLTVVALHSFSGLFWPLALFRASGGGVSPLRLLAAFWITAPCAGLFLYCAILSVQGTVAQLPRGWFLRLSAFLQLGAFALMLGVIFLQPSFLTLKALSAPENQQALAWLPPYWFMGLFSELSGAHGGPAMAALANRALVGLAISMVVAGAAFVLSWLRTMRKIAEEPDILPGSRGGIWLPTFGTRQQTAIAQFIVRTLARSRQHRTNLTFFLGVGFAMVSVSVQEGMNDLRTPMNTALLVSSLLMMCVAVAGVRVAFARPLDLRANWLFQIAPMRGSEVCVSATRRALLVLAVLPVWIGSGAALLWLWPWADAVKHLVLLGLVGVVLVEVSLMGFRKIPFACSYLPGKSKVHIMFAAALALLPILLVNAAEVEQWVVSNTLLYGAAVVVPGAAIVLIRREFVPEGEIQFEEFGADELVTLGL